MPLSGSWFGSGDDFLGMTVNVKVHKVADVPIDLPGGTSGAVTPA